MAEIKLEWKGEAFVIPADRAFEVGELIEDIITLADLATMVAKPKMHKLARCFAVMLEFAGAKVTPHDVHKTMMAEFKTANKSDQKDIVVSAVMALITILMDGAPEDGGDGDNEKKVSHSSETATS